MTYAGNPVGRNLAMLSSATFLSVLAERLSLLFVLSFIVMAGPGGEGIGTGSLELLLPVVVLGCACGVFADSVGARRAIISASLLRAALVFATPMLMSLTGVSRMATGACVAAISTASLLFSIGKFSILPQIIPPKSLPFGNSVVWTVSTLATIFAAYAVAYNRFDILPHVALKTCSVIFVLVSAAAWLIKIVQSTAPTRRGAQLPAFSKYLQSHRSSLAIFRLMSVLSFVFASWNILLLYVILQNYEPGGVDLHPLFVFAFGGTAVGCALATRADRIARPYTIICGTLLGLFLSSLICVSATNLTAVKYAVGVAGLNAGIALVTIDTILQRSFPTRFRGTIAGCRDSVVCFFGLIAVMGVEQTFEKISLITTFRVLGGIHVAFGLCMFFTWSRFGRFITRLMFWPLMARSRKIVCDSPHYLHGTRCSVFVCPDIRSSDALVIAGAFEMPTRFLIISNRLRAVDKFVLSLFGGHVVRDEDGAIAAARAFLSQGCNVIMPSDALLEEKNKLTKDVTNLLLQYKFPLIPCALIRDGVSGQRLQFKCGIPFTTPARKATPKKLSNEIRFLREAETAGGEAHV